MTLEPGDLDPVDKFDGTPLRDWIASIPEELDVDAVGLWQIIPAMRHDYGLNDDAIECATRQALAGLLARDARPVVASMTLGEHWTEVTRYGDTTPDIIDAVIAEWRALGRDPDVEDVWFARPEIFKDD